MILNTLPINPIAPSEAPEARVSATTPARTGQDPRGFDAWLVRERDQERPEVAQDPTREFEPEPEPKPDAAEADALKENSTADTTDAEERSEPASELGEANPPRLGDAATAASGRAWTNQQWVAQRVSGQVSLAERSARELASSSGPAEQGAAPAAETTSRGVQRERTGWATRPASEAGASGQSNDIGAAPRSGTAPTLASDAAKHAGESGAQTPALRDASAPNATSKPAPAMMLFGPMQTPGGTAGVARGATPAIGTVAGSASVGRSSFVLRSTAGTAARTPMAAPSAHATSPGARPNTAAAKRAEDVFAAQASRGLAAALRQGHGTLTLRLEPEGLGSLRIAVTREGGAMHATIEAADEPARRLLGESLNQLRSAMESRGVELGRLEIVTPAEPGRDTASVEPGAERAFDAGRERGEDRPPTHEQPSPGQGRRGGAGSEAGAELRNTLNTVDEDRAGDSAVMLGIDAWA